MYKRDDYYYSRIQPILLMKEMDENYQAETDLVRSIMKECISEMIVRTRHELAVANECLWSLNDRDEEYGFSHSGSQNEFVNIRGASLFTAIYRLGSQLC